MKQDAPNSYTVIYDTGEVSNSNGTTQAIVYRSKTGKTCMVCVIIGIKNKGVSFRPPIKLGGRNVEGKSKARADEEISNSLSAIDDVMFINRP